MTGVGNREMAFDIAQDTRFEFATATHIIFGADALREIGPLAKAMGRQALVVVTPERILGRDYN